MYHLSKLFWIALLLNISIITSVQGAFIESDFSFVVSPENNSIQQGGIANFYVELTNHSTETAIFGTNIRSTFSTADGTINDVAMLDSPYLLDWNFEAPFPFELTVVAGESIVFDFYSILVSSEISLNSVITLASASMGFENIPAAYPDDNKAYDFYISSSNEASVTIVPIPSSLYLMFSGGLLLFNILRRKSNS
ncbi:MAG: hypothetical protein KAT90_01280 [Gammaproteobacteria bacterium]|nr:hypothetical protein [Gammaproteobacteria bacterium]